MTCQPADADRSGTMDGQGPCYIPKFPSPMGKWLGELHCSSPESPPTSFPWGRPSQLWGFRHPCLALISPDGFPAWSSRVPQPACLAPAPTLQHITEVLQATGLTQQGVKVCREVTVITSSSARAPDALRNKNDCWSNKRGEQEISQAAWYSLCRHYNRDKEDRGAARGLRDK